ncbi:helix-turn-helix domain-containing protein [Shewanella surugensis]|uniref:Helix-turn-helix domain-containing protein n=1 Tax=Shewanella surugensis TaxID=212020 RepID=A0ABT0L728_9GAMM|nr:helix-turn-helix transcriptional regulator [Shewanella surugensis]MCL1122961.1 helix-turn-helix domain-containing protein [Shewanella surugensis]
MTELKSIAKRFDLSVAELAKIMEVKEGEVSQWQLGTSEPSTRKLCKLFGFISRHYLVQDSSNEEFMIGRDDQPAFNPDCEDNALMPELSQEENEKVRTKLNQVTSVTNMLLLLTDGNALHHGSLSFMSDALLEMKQILKT